MDLIKAKPHSILMAADAVKHFCSFMGMKHSRSGVVIQFGQKSRKFCTILCSTSMIVSPQQCCIRIVCYHPIIITFKSIAHHRHWKSVSFVKSLEKVGTFDDVWRLLWKNGIILGEKWCMWLLKIQAGFSHLMTTTSLRCENTLLCVILKKCAFLCLATSVICCSDLCAFP